ncbi:hypothetical protein SAMN05444413_101467 [Roseivivax marinus]|uniref:cupin n=1 Tax=Roseivivax marinus TaxID=1379903 RepID=UPI0008B85F7E|nr:cupin [Roseivivax marinus]SEK38616.1 hypothetical protein SAMN05444413_101467 [Roseivivax marinus]
MCKAGGGTATGTVLIENERVRVTEWQFAARGDNTGWHRHDCDYVVVPKFDGILEVDSGGDAPVRVETRADAPYFRQRGVEHDVINGNDFPCAFVEIELLENGRG